MYPKRLTPSRSRFRRQCQHKAAHSSLFTYPCHSSTFNWNMQGKFMFLDEILYTWYGNYRIRSSEENSIVLFKFRFVGVLHRTYGGANKGFPRGEAVTGNGSSEPFPVTDEGCRAVILKYPPCIRPILCPTARHPSSDPLYPRCARAGHL